jgi:Mg2+/Co2+ transporter CorB
MDRLRTIATNIETNLETKGIRDRLAAILELADLDVRASRMDRTEMPWITFQRQREAWQRPLPNSNRSRSTRTTRLKTLC